MAKEDSHSYRGWLNSDSFLKRVFAIFGYGLIANLLIGFGILLFILLITLIFP